MMIRRGIVVAHIVLLVGLMCWQVSAQSATTDWEKAAGGKMSFDVAALKQNTSDSAVTPTFPLDDGDAYSRNGGLLSSTDTPFTVYVAFAYKLNPAQAYDLRPQLPKWANTDRFDIEARAGAAATKDQMRLMMQSLLADRFKLAAHWEAENGKVLALVLAKPGKTGPQLRASTGDASCADVTAGPAPHSGSAFDASGFPTTCGAFMIHMNGAGHPLQLGSRNITIQYFANHLSVLPGANLGQPVLDQTGLRGRFDVLLSWTPDRPVVGGPPESADTPSDLPGSTFLEALTDQLGLKLQQTTGSISKLIIDHIEEPSPN